MATTGTFTGATRTSQKSDPADEWGDPASDPSLLPTDLREVPLAAATHRDGIFPGALKVESSPRTVSPTCARPATHGEEVKKVTERPWGEDVVGAEQAQMVVPISIEILLHHKWLFGETFICFWWFVFPDIQVS